MISSPIDPASGGISTITDADIVETVVAILGAQEDPAAPIYLATLGHLLSAHFQKPLRNILGDRKLRTIIEGAGYGRLLVDGVAHALTARLSGEANPSLALRYDPVFWAAFAKPPPEGKQRVVYPRRPFNLADEPEGQVSEGWIAIDRDFIPSTEMSKPTREEAIKRSIISWCEKNGLRPNQFIDLKSRSVSPIVRQTRQPLVSSQVSEYILSILELIPPEKRENHMISLEMIYDILKAGR